ncbi:MAG: nickel insertion protein, partial [Peptostreptococcaceae bacterium]
MRILYFDCFAGISGDMTLGAFIDLGVDKEILIKELSRLNVDGYEIEVSKKSKNGIVGTDVDVILNDNNEVMHDEHHNIDKHYHDHVH